MVATRYYLEISLIDSLKILKNAQEISLHAMKRRCPGTMLKLMLSFYFFIDKRGVRIKKFQYTAIDDCTRIRALKIYEKHTQVSAIDFINHVVEKFPFRIKMIRIDNGHEFQTKFHWHVKDLGMEHVYIKPGTPRLNGKVERSHLTDKREFYQMLDYRSS